jgi:hypothetical protein
MNSSKLREKFKGANLRLIGALSSYLILIVIALVVLTPARTSHERSILGLVLAFFAILMVKTIVHSRDDSE